MRAVNQPESWWGWHGWDQPQPMTIVEIMQAGTLPPRLAAAFWLGFERGASFIFAADPPGAGKTTLLSSLLPFARPETVVYFTRGWGETFELPPPSDAYPTYMMVNEISDHLPVYSWGPYVVRIFELLAEGYALCSTLHADTVEAVIDQLVADVSVDRAHVGELTFVVPLAVDRRDGRTLRRVRDVGLPDAEGVRSIATWDERADAFSVLDDTADCAALAQRLGMSGDEFDAALARREQALARLVADADAGDAALDRAIESVRRAEG